MPLSYLLEPNAVIHSRYQIAHLIGQGGMGAVYQALDLRLKAPVALKQMLAGGSPYDQALQREARILAGLRHPSLPRVIDCFGDGDDQFLVMEFIPGDDLMARLAQRGAPFPLVEVAAWADQLLDALEYLHSQQPPVLHRDIKPQNLKLTARGSIVLLDFGLAKGAIGTHAPALSGTSIFGYTPQYAPLEQIRGTGTNERSDLYALAATLYHLLAGTPPPDVLERASALISAQPDPLRPINTNHLPIPADFVAPLMQALALDPVQRPACATDLRAALAKAYPEYTERQAALPAHATAALPRLPEAAPVTIVEPAIPRRLEIEEIAPLAHARERRAQPHRSQPERRIPAWLDRRLALLITLTVAAAIMWSQYRALPTPTAFTGPAGAYLLSEPIRYFQEDGWIIYHGVRFSPDGQKIAAAIRKKDDPENSVQLWQTRDGGDICKVRLGNQPAPWPQIAFSPNSKTLITSAGGVGIRLWNTSDCSLQRTFSDVQSEQSEFALASNGKILALASVTGVQLWSVESGLQLHTIAGLNDVADLVFTPDNQTILVLSRSGEIQQFRVADGSSLRPFRSAGPDSRSLAIAPDGQTFVVGRVEGKLQLWRISDGTLLYEIATGFTEESLNMVQDIAFSPDGKTIAVAVGGAIELRRSSDGALLQRFGEPYIDARSVDFASDGRTIIAGFAFGTVKVWRVN